MLGHSTKYPLTQVGRKLLRKLTYVYFHEFFPLWSEIECNTVHVTCWRERGQLSRLGPELTWQGGGSRQQDEEDQVREQGREVHQLRDGLCKHFNLNNLPFTFPMDLIPLQRAQ